MSPSRWFGAALAIGWFGADAGNYCQAIVLLSAREFVTDHRSPSVAATVSGRLPLGGSGTSGRTALKAAPLACPVRAEDCQRYRQYQRAAGKLALSVRPGRAVVAPASVVARWSNQPVVPAPG